MIRMSCHEEMRWTERFEASPGRTIEYTITERGYLAPGFDHLVVNTMLRRKSIPDIDQSGVTSWVC